MSDHGNPGNIGRNIEAITFDAVGTLIVPYPSVGAIYSEELGKFGYDIRPDVLENNLIKSFRQFKKDHPQALLNKDSWRRIVATALFGLIPDHDFDKVFSALWQRFARPEHWSILLGVEETLHKLRSAGLRLFVLSNNDERLHTIFQGLVIGPYFEAIFVSSELGAEKPSRRIFDLVQIRIQVAAENILHVGDSPEEDVQGALDAGWQAALVGPRAATFGSTSAFKRAASVHALFCNT